MMICSVFVLSDARGTTFVGAAVVVNKPGIRCLFLPIDVSGFSV